MWQIMDSKSLPSLPITGDDLSDLSRRPAVSLPIKLFGRCFDRTPSKRPNAALVAQILLDEYNDRCAKAAFGVPEVERIMTVKGKCWDLLKACRNQYWNQNTEYEKVIPEKRLDEVEVFELLQSLESWNEPASLLLAPEMHFLIGAGVFWGFISPKTVNKEGPAENTKSPLGT